MKSIIYLLLPTLFILPPAARALEISNDLFSGSVTGYIDAYQNCQRKSSVKLRQGEYETKAEFEARKASSKSSCEGFSRAELLAHWELRYDVNKEQFTMSWPQDDKLDLNIEALYKTEQGPKSFKRRWNGEKPSNFWCSKRRHNEWSCNGWERVRLAYPKVKLYDKEIKDINFRAKATQKYRAYMRYGDNDSAFGRGPIEIDHDPIKISVPVQDARSLKGREDDLFIRLQGEVRVKKGELKMDVKRVDIFDGSIDNKLASFKAKQAF